MVATLPALLPLPCLLICYCRGSPSDDNRFHTGKADGSLVLVTTILCSVRETQPCSLFVVRSLPHQLDSESASAEAAQLLVHMMWAISVRGSNLCLFVLLPFAYFYKEATWGNEVRLSAGMGCGGRLSNTCCVALFCVPLPQGRRKPGTSRWRPLFGRMCSSLVEVWFVQLLHASSGEEASDLMCCAANTAGVTVRCHAVGNLLPVAACPHRWRRGAVEVPFHHSLNLPNAAWAGSLCRLHSGTQTPSPPHTH